MENKRKIELAKKAFLRVLKIKKFSGLNNVRLTAEIAGQTSVDCLAVKADGTEIIGTVYIDEKAITACIWKVMKYGKPRYPLYIGIKLSIEDIEKKGRNGRWKKKY